MASFASRLAAAFFNPETGWKTTHFWGPITNWGLSIAAVYDMQFKSVDVVSYRMTSTMCIYSLFFMRFAWMVQPRSYLLLACHGFNEVAQCTQLFRKWSHDQAKAQAALPAAGGAEKVLMAAAAGGPAGWGIVPKIQAQVLKAPMPDVLRASLASPAGPFTIHFWAPMFKWNLSFANLADYARPVDQVSTAQQFALVSTGLIWTRWSFVITPTNYILAAVNFTLAGSSGYHLTRKFIYDPFPAETEEVAEPKKVAESAEASAKA